MERYGPVWRFAPCILIKGQGRNEFIDHRGQVINSVRPSNFTFQRPFDIEAARPVSRTTMRAASRSSAVACAMRSGSPASLARSSLSCALAQDFIEALARFARLSNSLSYLNSRINVGSVTSSSESPEVHSESTARSSSSQGAS